MENIHEQITNKIQAFINKIIFIEKKNMFKFEGLTLYPSEIHLILIMSEKPTNATQMAEMLHVTKGAVSQTIARLEKKGILKKTKDPYYKNELTLTFTPLGKRAFEQYKKFSESLDEAFKAHIASFKYEELAVVDRFMDHLMKLADHVESGT